MPQVLEKYKIAILIVEDAKRNKLSKFLNAHKFNCHFGALGKGTAPSEIASLLGFSEPNKAIVFMVVEENRVSELFKLVDEEFCFTTKRGAGLALTIPIVSVAHIDIIKHLISEIETNKKPQK